MIRAPATRAAVVGVSVAVLFMALNKLFVVAGLSSKLAYLVAYVVAIAAHFSLNRFWTFEHRTKMTPIQIRDYIGVTVLNFAIQTPIFLLLHDKLGMAQWLAAGIGSLSQMTISFVVMQKRVFTSAPVK